MTFLLTDDQKKLPDEKKIAAKKPLAEQADSFAQAALQNPSTFEQAAKDKGFQVIQTERVYASNNRTRRSPRTQPWLTRLSISPKTTRLAMSPKEQTGFMS